MTRPPVTATEPQVAGNVSIGARVARVLGSSPGAGVGGRRVERPAPPSLGGGGGGPPSVPPSSTGGGGSVPTPTARNALSRSLVAPHAPDFTPNPPNDTGLR